jgi:hypothetical protein
MVLRPPTRRGPPGRHPFGLSTPLAPEVVADAGKAKGPGGSGVPPTPSRASKATASAKARHDDGRGRWGRRLRASDISTLAASRARLARTGPARPVRSAYHSRQDAVFGGEGRLPAGTRDALSPLVEVRPRRVLVGGLGVTAGRWARRTGSRRRGGHTPASWSSRRRSAPT